MTQTKAGRSRIILAGVLLSLLPSLAVGTAHADTNGFLREVHRTVRGKLSDNQALRLGAEACHVLRKGPDGQTVPESRGQAAQSVVKASRKLSANGNFGLDGGSAWRLVEAAEHQLC